MSIIAWLVVGAIAGFIASRVVPGDEGYGVVGGLVAGIVKLDDFGLYLSRRASSAARGLGAAILLAAPWLMKALAVAGTAAMFLVGGGILVHGVAPLHHAIERLAEGMAYINAAYGAAMLGTMVELGSVALRPVHRAATANARRLGQL